MVRLALLSYVLLAAAGHRLVPAPRSITTSLALLSHFLPAAAGRRLVPVTQPIATGPAPRLPVDAVVATLRAAPRPTARLSARSRVAAARRVAVAIGGKSRPLPPATPRSAGDGRGHGHADAARPSDAKPARSRSSRWGRWSSSLMAALGLGSVLTFGAPAWASAAGPLADFITKANEAGFVQSFLLIFVSEIGDKTFFIAGLLAAKYGRLISFGGSIGALAVMTVISTILGQVFHSVPSSLSQGVPFDDIVAVLAFAYFGVKTLYDASKLKDNDNSGIEDEKAEAEEAVEGLSEEQKRDDFLTKVAQTFSLVFAAEIGDRSFISTIALSAALDPYAVAGGAIAAHGAATGVAVAGGVLLSQYLSEKVIGYIGGGLFLVFAVTTALGVF